MLLRKIFYLPLFIFISGCVPSYAPEDWLAETEKVPEEAYGGWLTVFSDSAKTEIKGVGVLGAGEFIGSDSNYVYLLTDSLIIIKKNIIEGCVLEVDQKSTDMFALWTLLGSLSTFSHGFYLVLSFPTWLVTGGASAEGESERDRYKAEYPKREYWQIIQKFARFPQGIPPDLDLKELKPKVFKAE